MATDVKESAAESGASQQQAERSSSAASGPWVDVNATKVVQAIVFGVVFGFLLQKGGVAKFDILIGALLLENFVVEKVMISAIVVGMVGVYALKKAGVVELQIKETVYASNVIGGLMFGLGFALIAYCPGTDAAALGQGNLDALTGVAGMILGSYLFAASSKVFSGSITKRGNRGKITLPELTGVSEGVFIAVAAPVLAGVLALLHIIGD